MKYFGWFVLVFIAFGCNPRYTAFEYVSYGQTGEYRLKVTKDSLTFKQSGHKTKYLATPIDSKTWKQIKKEATKFDHLTMDTLSAPTKGRLVDKAQSAYIKVFLKDTIYRSQEFDGLKPNEILKPFTDSLFRLTVLLPKK